MRSRRMMRRTGLVSALAMALIALPEPVTTVVGVALLGLSVTLPELTGQEPYRPAPCCGVVIRRGTLPR